MKTNPPKAPRELPPNFKHILETSTFKKFTFKERLQILIGYNLRIKGSTVLEHLPGKVNSRIVANCTKDIE